MSEVPMVQLCSLIALATLQAAVPSAQDSSINAGVTTGHGNHARSQHEPGPAVAGNVVAVSIGPDSVDLTLAGGPVARVETLDAGVTRLRLNPTGTLSTRVSPAIDGSQLVPPGASIVDLPDSVWITTPRMTVAVLKAPFRVVALHPDGSLMAADLEPGVYWSPGQGSIASRKYAPRDEHYFGLGLRGGPIDRRGRTITMWNVDSSGYSQLTDPLYQSYPFYYGVRGGKAYGIFFDNPSYTTFELDPEGKGEIEVISSVGELDYYLIAGPTPFEVANGYARLTGLGPLPPRWTLGYHHSRYGWQSAAEILQIANDLRQQGFPCDSLWFDIDYMDQFHHFTWDPIDFPDPVGLHAALDTMGFERVYINEPCLLATDPLWWYFDLAGYFLTEGFGNSIVGTIWLGDVSWIDYSKTVARDWYKEQLKSFLSLGISALWNDLNEPAQNIMPEAVHDFDGEQRTDLEARNLYALLVNRTAWTAQKELRPDVRPWNFSRSGYSGIQRWACTWSGDANSDFEALHTNVQMSISMGLSGQNQFGHDIGGFLGTPSAELFVRWMEFSLYTPLFRNHSINTSDPREPWVFGQPYTSIIRGLIEQRYRLLPYIYTLFEEASRSGRPVLAPAWFYASGDPGAYAQDLEFLLGPNILVAPVVVQGASSRTLRLPAGSGWFDLYTDDFYAGNQTVTMPAPLGSPPVFVREGAILPRGPLMTHTGAGVVAELDVTVYPGLDSSFTLYEDDGAGFGFEGGDFLRTQIDRTSSVGGVQLLIQRVQGTFDPGTRPWMLRLIGFGLSPTSVALNGIVLPFAPDEAQLLTMNEGWTYQASAQRVLVRMQDASSSLQVVVTE